MSKIKSVVWNIEPHTEAKHAILKKYLDAWLPIMTNFSDRVLYVDGFAGPGRYSNGEEGSPLIAINAALNHRRLPNSEINMIFIEDDKDRLDSLKDKIFEMKCPNNLKTMCVKGKFSEVAEKILTDFKSVPTFFFIDPFGWKGIPMSIIKKIMANPKYEVLITFMYEEINRFLDASGVSSSLNEVFGSGDWVYTTKEKDPGKRLLSLHNLYKNQLGKVAEIKYVESFKMINKANRTDYFLFFGTNSIDGLKKMKSAMWKVDESGLFQFSDATYNPLQPTLMETVPDYDLLKALILNQFRNKKVRICDLERFILTKTPFRETHYKRTILQKMEKTNPPELLRCCADCGVQALCKRKKSFFTEDCVIQLL